MSKRTPAPKPAHYKVICVSFYTDDMARLDAAVAGADLRLDSGRGWWVAIASASTLTT